MPHEALAERPSNDHAGLGASARVSVLWSGGSTLFREVMQFGVMLILVRLLTPEDYGNAALAQSILASLSVLSFANFSLHALQIRNPMEIDWQAHFTAAAVINSCLCGLTVTVAVVLWFTRQYHGASLPLAALAVTLLIEVPGTLRHRMLEATHDWRRFRVLLSIGTFLAVVTGLIVGLLGGGVWALVVQVPILGLPAAIDLFSTGAFRPNWSWSWMRYREATHFGLNRMGSSFLIAARRAVESAILAATYSVAALGIFTRSIGLAALIGGRIGAIIMTSLYPVLTRAGEDSQRFQRMTGMVLRSVCWVTVPSAMLLVLCAEDVVALLYGPKWDSVSRLLPLAAAVAVCRSTAAVASSLLLANNKAKTCLAIELLSGVSAISLALGTVPIGIEVYLAAVIGQMLLISGITLAFLRSTLGITVPAIAYAILPPALAALAAATVLIGTRYIAKMPAAMSMRLFVEGLLFATSYLLVLRVTFPSRLREILMTGGAGDLLRLVGLYPHPQAGSQANDPGRIPLGSSLANGRGSRGRRDIDRGK